MAFLNGKRYSRGTVDTGATFAALAARAVSANEIGLDANHTAPQTSDITAPEGDNYIYSLKFSLPQIPGISRFDLQFPNGVDEYVAWGVGFTLNTDVSTMSHTQTINKTSASTTSSITVSSTGNTATNIKSWDFTIYLLEKTGPQTVRFKLGYRKILSGTTTDTAPIYLTGAFDPVPVGVPRYDFVDMMQTVTAQTHDAPWFNQILKNIISVYDRSAQGGDSLQRNQMAVGPSQTGGNWRGLALGPGDIPYGGAADIERLMADNTDLTKVLTLVAGPRPSWEPLTVATITPLYQLYIQANSPSPVIF